MKTAKEKIDALPVRELYEFRCSVEHLPREQQVVEAGRFLAKHWILHWNGTDSEYLLQKANVKIKY